MIFKNGTLYGAVVLLASSLPLAKAGADDSFYQGRTINVVIGVGAGGFYDLNARLVARYIGRHIPGNPTLVPQNMTGAGGATMLSYMTTVAARDGTYIGMIANNFPAMQAAGIDAIKIDLTPFEWIGSISPLTGVMTVTKSANVNTISEGRTKEIIVGASGRGAETYSMPAMMNEFLGTRFKIVTGYRGGSDINLAMERGEVQGRYNFWSSWKVTRPEWVRDKEIISIAYMGPKPADLPGVPSVVELAGNDDERRIINLIISGTRLGTPLAFAGGVPADRVATMRAAFNATMRDPEFLAEAEKLQIAVDPVIGEDLQKIVADVLATPKPLAARARAFLE
jgi:tripartite-type tricarboxylate transporter receptor subunit TctC